MKRTLKVVFDDISDFTNAHGTFYSVGALFDDDSLLKANKKSRDAAQELRGILLELVDIECDYYCDDAGQASTGRQMWKLKAILDAEGGSIYGKPPQNAQGGGAPSGSAEPARPQRNVAARPPESSDKDAEIRAAVALKAAAIAYQGREIALICEVADEFTEWLKLKSKSSGSEANSTPAPQGAGSPGRESATPSTGPDPSAAVESSASSPPGTPPAAGTSSPDDTRSAMGAAAPERTVTSPAAGGTSSAGVGDGEAPAPADTIHEWDAKGPAGWTEEWEGMGVIEKQ